MRARLWLGWMIPLVLSLHAARAQAAELDWNAPGGCPDAADLRFGVERAIGMPLSRAAPLRFTVRAEQGARGYAARVVTESQPGTPRGERQLEAKDCARLADMVTVTVALALGATVGAADEAAPASEATPEAVTAGDTSGLGATDPGQSGAAASAGADEPWRPALSAWFLGDTGSLPDPGAGVALAAQLDRGWLGLRALGTLLFDQRQALGPEPTAGPAASLGLLAGSLSACAAPFGNGGSALSVSACAGWELGRLSGEGSGVLDARTGAALWSAPRLDFGASLAFAVSGLRLGTMLTLAAPLIRDDFVLREFGAVHRPRAVIGRAAVGLEWAL